MPEMEKMIGGREDAIACKAVFVDTNLDTHLAVPVSSVDTMLDLKRKIMTEHLKYFRKFGQIEVHALQVKRRGKLYSLSDLIPVSSVFSGTANGWFLFANISSQFGHCEAVEHNTEFLTDPQNRMLLIDTSPASQLQRGCEKDQRNLKTDNMSGEARSENLQLVAGFKHDDNVKSSSSDTSKRLNAIVEDVYNVACGKAKNSSGLVTEVTSVNRVSKSLNNGSLEKNKPKKKREIVAHVHPVNADDAMEIGSAYKESASQKLEFMKNLDQNVADSKHCHHDDTGAGSAGQNKREDKSSEINYCESLPSDSNKGPGGQIEQTSGPHSVGEKGPESHDRDRKDVTIGRNKTMVTTKKKKKRMRKPEMMDDETFTDIDASVNVSAKSFAAPVDAQCKGSNISEAYRGTSPDKAIVSDSGRTEEVGAKNMSMHVQCNSSTSSRMDAVVTEEAGRLENFSDVRDSEKQPPTFEVAPESGMKRSKKRKNGGDVSYQTDIKENEELGVPEFGDLEKGTKMAAELGMTRPLKRRNTGDDFPDAIKMDRVGDVESDMLVSKLQTQTQKSKRNIKSKQTSLVKNISEFPMRHQSDTIEPENSKSTLSKSAAEKDDNVEASSSSLDQIYEVLPLATAEAEEVLTTKNESDAKPQLGADETITHNDAERKHLTEVGVDEEVPRTKNESDVKPQLGADETITHNDAEPMQLTQIPKSSEGAEMMKKRSRKKAKQKQNLVASSTSEFSVKDQNNSMACDRSKPSVSKSKTSSSHSDVLNKMSHQGKVKELAKMKQHQSSLRKSSNNPTKKVVQNPSNKKSLISKSSSIFKDESSSSSEGEVGEDASNSSIGTPHDDHVSSSDYSEDESRGSWASPKHGNSKNGGTSLNSKSTQKNLTMATILRSSHKYKKAKKLAAQLQLAEDESQAIDVVPDSQK